MPPRLVGIRVSVGVSSKAPSPRNSTIALAYRKRVMTALWQVGQPLECSSLAGKRLIHLPIAVIQREEFRTISRGRLTTPAVTR
jgi:hypothetical protein